MPLWLGASSALKLHYAVVVHKNYQGALEVIKNDQSLKRNAHPKDMIGSVMWLASDMSAFVTGQTIAIDGGTVMS